MPDGKVMMSAKRIAASTFRTLIGRSVTSEATCGERNISFSKRAFTRSLQQLVPEITERDLVPCPAGVRAQALRHDGSLVDDFLLVRRSNTLHVCNAPSPAATASLEIAKEIVKQIPAFERTVVAAA